MAKLILIDEVNCKFEGLDPAVRQKMIKHVSYEIPGAKYTPAGRMGRWDCKHAFMTLGGSTFFNMLEDLLPILEEHNVDLEIEDRRSVPNFDFEPITEELFKDSLFPAGHHFEGKPVLLREHQVQAVNKLLEHRHGMLLASTSSGKAQPLDEPVLTTEGWKRMGDMCVGDYVITPDGKSAKVLGVYPQGIKPTVKVTLEDGRSTECCDEHLWNAYSTALSRTGYGQWYTLSTKEIVEHLSENEHSFYLPIVTPEDESIVEEQYSTESFVKSKLKIESIEYIESKECQCIYIDSPEHLYITRDYIVTHNTLICAALSKSVEKYGRSIIIVPSTDLVQQTVDDYNLVGLDAGVFYGGKKEFGHTHTITTWQSFNSLWKKTKKGDMELTEQDITDLIQDVCCVICDECHTLAGSILQALLGELMNKVPIRWGMTGTIPKDEVIANKIKCNIGKVVHSITAKELQDKKILSTCNINVIKLKSGAKYTTYHEELKYLTSDRIRMQYVSSLIAGIAQSGGNTLVLVDRIEAGDLICQYLGLPSTDFVKGETQKKKREAQYGEIRWTDNKILIATFGVASTGISISRLYNVVLIEPGKSFVRTIQSIGRGLRKAEDKDHVEIYDICGSNKYSSRHSNERIKYYKEVEYPYQVLNVKDWE